MEKEKKIDGQQNTGPSIRVGERREREETVETEQIARLLGEQGKTRDMLLGLRAVPSHPTIESLSADFERGFNCKN
ncbi:hypothetical protein MKX08_000442 [Trichoderma sp. CBMAI-0020]|nr:hypothetical protein MKX08_000442 [Trichoderma sp. CBMAI-0020]